jgi:hypothetical protein
MKWMAAAYRQVNRAGSPFHAWKQSGKQRIEWTPERIHRFPLSTTTLQVSTKRVLQTGIIEFPKMDNSKISGQESREKHRRAKPSFEKLREAATMHHHA